MVEIVGLPSEEERSMYEIFKSVVEKELSENKTIDSIENIQKFIDIINKNKKVLKVNFKNIFYDEVVNLQKKGELTMEDMVNIIEVFNQRLP